ncbi:YbaN family protein [Methylotenera sp. G11]|uniref:YbaN family protein n=1 Tax=Methylotenera sp. G11 TaxID=1506585 RepID=UPI00068A34A8|nr:YbaN family protein [Methylotenera sp. G11]
MSRLKLHHSPYIRHVFVALGFVALLLGVIGIFLPVMPTTPFILLAAALFARGSERFHSWLLAHHLAGPLITDWYEHRSLRPAIKRWAYLLTVISFSSSILIVDPIALKLLLLAFAAVLIYCLWRMPVRKV